MTPRTPPYVNKPRESCSAGFVEKSVSTGTESSMTGKWEDLRLRIKNFRSLPKCEEMSCSALCPATCRRLCSRRVDGTSLRYVRSTAVSHMFSVGMMENGASDGRGTPRESPRFSWPNLINMLEAEIRAARIHRKYLLSNQPSSTCSFSNSISSWDVPA